MCLHRTLEPNYKAVWESSACQQHQQGKKSTFLHIHRRIKYLGRKSSLLQMDTYRTKMGNFCAALLVSSIARIHLVADLKFSLEFLSCCHRWKYNSQGGWGWGPQVNSRSGGIIIKWAGKTPELAAQYALLPAWNLTQDGFQSWVRFSHKSQNTFTTRYYVRICYLHRNEERELEAALETCTDKEGKKSLAFSNGLKLSLFKDTTFTYKLWLRKNIPTEDIF